MTATPFVTHEGKDMKGYAAIAQRGLLPDGTPLKAITWGIVAGLGDRMFGLWRGSWLRLTNLMQGHAGVRAGVLCSSSHPVVYYGRFNNRFVLNNRQLSHSPNKFLGAASIQKITRA